LRVEKKVVYNKGSLLFNSRHRENNLIYMISKLISAFALVAIPSSILGKISFGFCRGDTPQLSWKDYEDLGGPKYPYPHPFSCMDKQLKELLVFG
jgi:hypothetical protein